VNIQSLSEESGDYDPLRFVQIMELLYMDLDIKEKATMWKYFHCINGSIIEVDSYAITNPCGCLTNPRTLVSKAIHEAAGSQLLDECNELGDFTHDLEIKITHSYNLKNCRKIIHINGPNTTLPNYINLLSSTYKKIFEQAKSQHFPSISIPIIGSGSGGYSNHVAIEICTTACILEALTPNNKLCIKMICFDKNLFDMTIHKISSTLREFGKYKK